MDFLQPILIFSVIFIALFTLAEVLHLIAGVQAEYTRKIVHIATGLITLGFPVYFSSAWQVIIICTLFLILLWLSKKLNFLRSIHNVRRETAGSVLYPVIVILVFLFYQYMKDTEQAGYINFYLPILVMAISDPAAALTGSAYKKKKKITTGKTMVGTITFILVAFVVSVVLMVALTDAGLFYIIVSSVVIAIITGITERISDKGWDNFTIPLSAMAILYLMNYL